jgi:D-threo-aldose 1-dehydrogenase
VTDTAPQIFDQLGRGPFWLGGAGLGNLGQAIDDETARATVDAAWDSGVRAFDTAPHYGLGLSERRLGAALAERQRDEYLISTKVGRLIRPAGSQATATDEVGGFAVPGDLHRVWDASADGVRRSLDESLERLGLDHVDIVYLHDPDVYGDVDSSLASALPALAELRDQGVVSAIGVGSNSVEALHAAVDTGIVDVIMLAGRYTLLEQPASDLVAMCADRGVSVIAVGVFNSGILSHDEPAPDLAYNYAAVPPEVLERARTLAAICRKHGVSLPEAALAFPRRAPAVRAVAVGAQSAEQVRENVSRAAAVIPEALWEDLRGNGLLVEAGSAQSDAVS